MANIEKAKASVSFTKENGLEIFLNKWETYDFDSLLPYTPGSYVLVETRA